MFPPVFVTLKDLPEVQAAFGLSPVRVFPFKSAPQGVARPYAVWQGVGGAPENYLGNRPDIDSIALQFDVYAETTDAARAAARALRDGIEPHAHIIAWRGEETDETTGYIRISFDVDWWVER